MQSKMAALMTSYDASYRHDQQKIRQFVEQAERYLLTALAKIQDFFVNPAFFLSGHVS